jgi:hypothetical protein
VKIECRIGEKEKPSIEKLNPKVKSWTVVSANLITVEPRDWKNSIIFNAKIDVENIFFANSHPLSYHLKSSLFASLKRFSLLCDHVSTLMLSFMISDFIWWWWKLKLLKFPNSLDEKILFLSSKIREKTTFNSFLLTF